MQIIIVGCGKVGSTITEQLSLEGHNITVIDVLADKVETCSNLYDVMGVIGNGAIYSIQKEAGIEEADLLIAVTGSDELNLLCCLIAKKAGNCQTIARVRNPLYSQEIGFIKEELGLSMIINPELASAIEMARILRFPSAIHIETFAKGRVELLTFRVRPETHLHNRKVMDISRELHCDVLICAVERNGEVTIPTGTFVLQDNDVVSFVAPPRKGSQFFKTIGVDTHRVKNTMIAGGGTIAYYLAKQLLALNIPTTIIDINKERCETLSDLLPKATIIHGDATDQDLLMEEGLETAESFVALTNLDEENILLSLFARAKSNAKQIVKINRSSFKEVIQSMDLGTIISPKYITANSILQYVRAMQNSIGCNIETLYKILDNRVEALEFSIKENSPVVDVPLEVLNLKSNLLLCSINRGGNIITPRGQDRIQLGDTVIVVTTNTGLHDIQDILAD